MSLVHVQCTRYGPTHVGILHVVHLHVARLLGRYYDHEEMLKRLVHVLQQKKVAGAVDVHFRRVASASRPWWRLARLGSCFALGHAVRQFDRSLAGDMSVR